MSGYHAPGDRMDSHNLDAAAHGGAFAVKSGLAPDVAGRDLIVPEGGLLAASAQAAWYTANAATWLRFHVPYRKAYRWVNLRVGTQSGNIQVGVSSLARTGTTVNSTKVMDSGVIACPAAGDQRIDCGTVTLNPGDYGLFLWCDNVTAQFLHSLATGLAASRMLFSQTGLASGVPSSVTTIGPTTRWVSGLTLESDS